MKSSDYSLKTQISFEAAHRLYNVNTYSEECRNNIHGHSYKVTVVVKPSESLNLAGMVIDFKQLKEILRNSIESKYDHSCILHESDPLVSAIVSNCKKVHVVKSNPTAEWMAREFYCQLGDALEHAGVRGVYVSRVEVQETENNIAIYERGW